MALKLKNGDYVSDGSGGLVRLQSPSQTLVQRVLFLLSVHRGTAPFPENLGSRLWKLGQLGTAERPGAAKQYVAEALADENLQITDVTLEPQNDGTSDLKVSLSAEGENYEVGLTLR